MSEKNAKKYFIFHTIIVFRGGLFLRVVIIGTGYVGLTSGVALVYLECQASSDLIFTNDAFCYCE